MKNRHFVKILIHSLRVPFKSINFVRFIKLSNILKLIIFFFIAINSSLLIANTIDEKYDEAVDLYQDGMYEEAESIFIELDKKNYADKNLYLYFIMGVIYRKKNQSNKAVYYLKKFIDTDIGSDNLAYKNIKNSRGKATIALTYELISGIDLTEENVIEAKKIVDDLKQSDMLEYIHYGDFTYNYALVYNAYGYFHMKIDNARLGDIEYYKNKVSKPFKIALETRPELISIANNLCISYRIILDKLDKNKNKKEFNKYLKLTLDVYNKERYKPFLKKGKFKINKDDFLKKYKNELKAFE